MEAFYASFFVLLTVKTGMQRRRHPLRQVEWRAPRPMHRCGRKYDAGNGRESG
jgi:hypothetical protein